MGYKTITKNLYCKNCQKNVKATAEEKDINHILHLILSVLTVGIWLIVWIFISLGINKQDNEFNCVECGNKVLTKGQKVKNIILLIFALAFIGILIFLALKMGVIGL